MDATQAVFMRDGLLAKLEMETQATMAMLEHLPEDKVTYVPDAKVKPFNELANHIFTVGVWFTNVAATGDTSFPEGDPPPAPATKQELIDASVAMNQLITKQAADASPEALATDIEFATFGTFAGVFFIDWHISHLIHHRAQLGMYLRLMGAKVPATYGDSLDYPMNM